MRIGVDLRSLQTPYRTGVGEYAAEFLLAIFKLDQENQYYLFFNSLSKKVPDFPGFTEPNAHILATRYPNKLLSLSSKLFNLPKIDSLICSRSNIPQLDYFFSPHLNFTPLSNKTKHILTIHDLTFDLFPNFLTMKQRWWHRLTSPRKQCERAHLILTPSVNTKRDIMDYYQIPENKIKVIYPGLSSLSFPRKRESTIVEPGFPILVGNDNDKFPPNYILFLGTLEPRKNIAGLITAYESAFPKLKTPHDLVIAGAPGWKNGEIIKLAKRSPLRDRIRFIGFVREEDKPALYRSAAVFVYPSFYEGFGFPILEAMRYGVPIITSNRSSLPEISDGAAYLVNAHRPHEIAAGLVNILNSPSLAKRFDALSREQSAKFNWEKSASELIDILRQS